MERAGTTIGLLYGTGPMAVCAVIRAQHQGDKASRISGLPTRASIGFRPLRRPSAHFCELAFRGRGPLPSGAAKDAGKKEMVRVALKEKLRVICAGPEQTVQLSYGKVPLRREAISRFLPFRK